jgi:AcrR family transcriptional regulator
MSRGAGPGRPRQQSTDDRIVSSALDLLREGGPAALTIEGVSARSGVARTTIYRRYRNRDELLAAALDQIIEGPFPPSELPLRTKVRWVLEQVAQLLEESLGRGSVAAVLTGSDPQFSAAIRLRIERRLAILRQLVNEDIRAGRVQDAADPSAVVSLLFGAYLGEVLRHGEPEAGWMEGITDTLVHALTAGDNRD